MPVEIERKYLVAGDGWRNAVEREIEMVQGYLTLDPERTVRVRLNDGSKAYLTVKGPTEEATRSEFEYEIPRDEARELLDMCVPPLIEKTRYMVESAEQTWESMSSTEPTKAFDWPRSSSTKSQKRSRYPTGWEMK